MELTGQAYEEKQEQNIRLVQQLKEKDDANLKLMSEVGINVPNYYNVTLNCVRLNLSRRPWLMFGHSSKDGTRVQLHNHNQTANSVNI